MRHEQRLKVMFEAYYSAVERDRDEAPNADYVIGEALAHFERESRYMAMQQRDVFCPCRQCPCPRLSDHGLRCMVCMRGYCTMGVDIEAAAASETLKRLPVIPASPAMDDYMELIGEL